MRPSPRFLTSGYLVLRFQRQYSIELCIYIITNETPRVETHSPSFPKDKVTGFTFPTSLLH